MSMIMNFLWFICGGVFMGLSWALAGVLMFVSIIGIPWGRACFVIAGFSFFPFGKTVVRRDEITGKKDMGTSVFGLAGNIIWFLLFGLWLGIGHLISAAVCFVTIILIPFGIQHLKLAGIALAPIGRTIVPNEVAKAARRNNAEDHIEKSRS